MRVTIIGAGAGGIAMAIALRRAGHEPTILERADGVGGTWHDNAYPGAGCDVPSHLYSYSFAPNDWERKYARQPEIRRYLERIVDEHELAPYLRLGTEVTAARFADDRWRVATSGGALVADAVVSGTGQLNRLHVPALPGVETFAGGRFHTARWPASFDPTGKSIAVIGTGASAIQIIPELVRTARRVIVLQRSPPYVIPRHDRVYPRWERWIYRNVPLVRRTRRALMYAYNELRFPAMRTGTWMNRLVHWMAVHHLRTAIRDPGLRAKLTPDYPLGCKRILISDDYYAAIAAPNVDVVTSPIERVTSDAVVTADGAAYAVDTIIHATGFASAGFLAPIDIVGRDGRRLHDTWRGGAEAHHGITVHGFPNLFLLYGPNTNLGHNSIWFMLECQVRYITRCLDALVKRGAHWLEPRADAMAQYNAALQRALATTAWAGACHNWYTTDGKITNNWSSRTVRYWWQNRRPDLAEYELGYPIR